MNQEIEEKRAWTFREEGDPIKSIAIMYGLFYQFESQKEWEKAINTLVDISLSWSVLGRHTNEIMYYQAALQAIEYIKDIAYKHDIPLRSDYNFHLGRVFDEVGNYEGAKEAFEAYLQFERQNLSEVQIAEVEVRLGHVLVKIGKVNDGTTLLRKSVETLSNLPEEISTQGKDLTAIKRTGAKLKLASAISNKEEAKKLMQEAISEAGRNNLGARLNEARMACSN